MGAPETTEIVDELYCVPPAFFVAARDELVRTARQAGSRELASELQGLRRPTTSAWLVNLLARHEREPLESLFGLGRQLRQAQTQLDAAQLRRLSAQRKSVIADLVDRARRRAAHAGVEPTEKVLSEVEATLHAALVDLAASSTVLSGRLVRPMSHSGFGPMPHVDLPGPRPSRRSPSESGPAESPPEPVPASPGVKERGPEVERWVFWPVDNPADGTGRRRAEQATVGQATVGQATVGQAAVERDAGDGQRQRVWPHLVAPTEPPARAAPQQPPSDRGEQVRRAEAELAAAESAHWQREQQLADAQAAVAAARDRLQWLEQQRLEARAGKATAERHLAEARAAQRSAVRAVTQARRALQAAEAAARPGAEAATSVITKDPPPELGGDPSRS